MATKAGVTRYDIWVLRNWTRARVGALKRTTSPFLADAVVWTAPNRTELVSVDVPPVGPDEITVAVVYSAISPGTERAQYLQQGTARVNYPFRPGYSSVGHVVRVGKNVTEFAVGDVVTTNGIPHQSLGTVEAGTATAVPDGVPLEVAALSELAVIGAVGVDRIAVAPGSTVSVIGAGAIGVLAGLTAVLRGAGRTVLSGRTDARRHTSCGLEFLTTDDPEFGRIGAAVVIDAVGTESSLDHAIAAAAVGATIVQLGSPRTSEFAIPIERLRERSIELTGAHISALDRPRRTVATEFLQGHVDGRIDASALITALVDPHDAGMRYRDLATSDTAGTALFDWRAFDRTAARFWSIPEVPARGRTFDGVPRIVDERGSSMFAADPMDTPRGELRVAIVGCGEVAMQNARGIHQAPNCSLATFFDTNRVLADDLGREYGARVADSFDDVLADPLVDAVMVSVPHHLHRPLSEQVLAAGKHLVIEKPLANTLADAAAIVRAADAAAGTATVCFPNRYDDRIRASRGVVSAGLVGDVQGFAVTFLQDKSPSYWTGGLSGRTTSDWRGHRATAGGGVLIMNACHYIDLLLHLTGETVEAVSAMWTPEPGRDIEQSVVANLRLSGGAVGTLSVSSSVRGTRHDELRLWGTDGHVEAFPTSRVFPLRAAAPLSAARWNLLTPPPVDMRTAYFTRLSTQIADSAEPDVTIRDGLAVQGAVEAIYLAAETGATVRPGDLIEEALDRAAT